MESRSAIRRLLPFIPYTLVSALHVVLLFADLPGAPPTKLLLMPLLAAAVVWVCRSEGTRFWGVAAALVLGIGLSWLGDGAATFFPMFDDELPMMLLCFGLAHVVYVVLMWRGPGIAERKLPGWSLIYVAAYVALMVVLVPHTGSLMVPVMLYGLLLVATAAVASRCGAVVAWGGFWFLVSDAILAFRIFIPDEMPDWTGGAVMLTYTLGQGLITYGIAAKLRRRLPAPETAQASTAQASNAQASNTQSPTEKR